MTRWLLMIGAFLLGCAALVESQTITNVFRNRVQIRSTENVALDVLGGMTVGTGAGSGSISARTYGAGIGMEVHIRPNSAKGGYVTLTEDTVADKWAIGTEAGASSPLVFRSGSTSGTIRLQLSSTGVLTVPSQPGFLAYNSATDNGQVAGATVDFDTEVYDEAGNFAADTFTAPVTGRYLLCSGVLLTNGSATTATPINVRFDTSNAPYYVGWLDSLPASSSRFFSACVHADMDASDTANVEIAQNTENINISGSGTRLTYFSGRLVP